MTHKFIKYSIFFSWRKANSATIWAHIQSIESVCLNIYSIYELLECLKKLVLQNRITITLGNSRILEISLVYWILEISIEY